MGIVTALQGREFRLSRIADFLLTKLGPLLAAYGVAVRLSWAMPDYRAVR